MSNLDQKINLSTLSLSNVAAGIISSIDDIRDHNFLANGLCRVPFPLQARLAKQYIERYRKNQTKAGFKANEWFRRTIAKLKPRFGVLFTIGQEMPLPWHIISNKDKTKDYATTTAKTCLEIILDVGEIPKNPNKNEEQNEATKTEIAFKKVGKYCESVGVTLQYWELRHKHLFIGNMQIALLKAQCEKWWARKLKIVRKRYLELLEIATGQVGKDLFRSAKGREIKRKGISPYSSRNAQAEFLESQKSGRKFLERLELESDKGEVIDLIDAVDAGMSNPVNRRNELMLRIRESEELANEIGYTGMFYTMTCPSKYHPNSENWNGSTPKQAQSYLVQTWARARAKLNRLNIQYFGIRVAEPHADGCPHWHMLLFIKPNQVQTATAIARKHFIIEDRAELINRYGFESAVLKNKLYTTDTTSGITVTYQEFTKPCRKGDRKTILFNAYKKKRQQWGLKKAKGIKDKAPEKFYRTFAPRFTAVKIDPAKGTAAGYVAKYISKNIDGYQVTDHEDAETGENIQVNPVLAWASTWGIRQFQMQGSPSVTVYRELRKVREPIKEETLERVRLAADNAQWKEFVKLMGGMCIGRNANFKTAYQETPFGNDYAEVVKRVKGVFSNADETAQAIRMLKGEYSVETSASLITRDTEWTKQTKGTAAANKAEGLGFADAGGQSWTSGNNCTPLRTTTSAELQKGRLSFTKQESDQLKNGSRLLIDGYIYQFLDGKIRSSTEVQQIEKQKQDEIKHFAHTHARKNGFRAPTNAHFLLATEHVNLAFNNAANNNRIKPNAADWLHAQQIADGETEQEWWD